VPEKDIPRYDPRTIEPRWQRRWEEIGLFRAATHREAAAAAASGAPARPRSYCLMMFPYPSGDRLHVGHGRNYILGDAVVRYKLMRGMDVLSPMGWDAFGLPAENDAIKKRIAPWTSVRSNIARMKEQFRSWGVGYDWSRELATCDPGYYKWTQWLFLKLYERGLAYRKQAPVNWCPSCATVLANEQVEPDNTCERCGTLVEAKELTQWFFRITAYADRLVDDLEKLGSWPERVKTLQRMWIGRSVGARIDFALDDGTPLPVFTTRPDTLFGVTFVSVAPEHAVAARAAAARPEVRAFVERMKATPDRGDEKSPKEGVPTGLFAVNPANGERVPVYVASYALIEYGTGAVMAVPAHDQRDFEFAKAYGLPIRVVIQPPGAALDAASMKAAYVEAGTMAASGEFTGRASEEGKAAVAAWLAARGKGAPEKRFRIRDWLLSRQRYWGAPIPIVYGKDGAAVAVSESELPVLLPHDRGLEVEVRPSGTGKSPLANIPEFVNVAETGTGTGWVRETDTMDTFVDSAWYFLRFASPNLESAAFEREEVARWLPVEQYIGGAEHATKHLIYARFITKFLFDEGYVSFDEPFPNLFSQGLICKKDEKGELHKMSKSKGNVVNPDELIAKFGADTQRLYTLFIGPPEYDAEWQDDGVLGAHRFLHRLWTLVHESLPSLPPAGSAAPAGIALSAAGKEWRRKRHETVGSVSAKFQQGFHFHTATSAIMELVNTLKAGEPANDADRSALRDGLEAAVLCIAPMVPHFAEEAWRALGHDVPTVFRVPWPSWDPELAKEAEIEIAIQVNGKVRGREVVPRDAGEARVREVVLANERVKGYVDGKMIAKVIVVPNKLVNIVVK
jgi:leucyl-tRNA synthetase